MKRWECQIQNVQVFLLVMGFFSSSYLAVSSDFFPLQWSVVIHFYCHLRKRHKYSLVRGAGYVVVNTSQMHKDVHTQYNRWGECLHAHAHMCPKALSHSFHLNQNPLCLWWSLKPCVSFWRGDLLEWNPQPSNKSSWQVAIASVGIIGPPGTLDSVSTITLWVGEGRRGEYHSLLACSFAQTPFGRRIHACCHVL